MEEFRYSQIRVSCSTYLTHELLESVLGDLTILDEVLLSYISCCQIPNSVNRNNSCVFNRSEKILKGDFNTVGPINKHCLP